MEKTKRRGAPLHVLMLAGFLIGLLAGLWVNLTVGADAAWVEWTVSNVTGPIGQIFLRLLLMLVLPLLFAALVMGVAEMGDLQSLGRVGLKTLVMTVVLSAIAVAIGLALVNWVRPGDGITRETADALLNQYSEQAQSIVENAPETINFGTFLLDLVPSNPIAAAANMQVLPFMVFALLFGVGLVMVKSPATDRLQQAIQGLFEVMMRLINLVISVAPIAVACLMFNLAAVFGWDLMRVLALYCGVALGAMAIHMFIVYPVVIALFARMSPATFFTRIREPIVTAFSTASSNATLPVSLRTAQDELKLPRKISRFVLTVGATANQNGTALFEGVTVLFLAQFFGVELSLTQQIVVMLICILGGVGTAGVPAGSLPVIVMILGMVGVPPLGIAIVLGVDRLLDMCRTTLNVTGDLVITSVVSRGEKDPEPTPPELEALEARSSAASQ